jgi:hypothetical protein
VKQHTQSAGAGHYSFAMTRAFKISGTPKPGPQPPATDAKDPRYHAVAIHCSGGGCQAVQALKARRYLSRQSPPMLPLKDCDNPAGCTCKYVHHDDRRDHLRREADTGIWDTTKLAAADNRRRNGGRRQSD